MNLLPGYGHVVETDSGQALLPGYGWLVQTSSVGPTYTMAADGASFSLTGTAAGLRASRLLTAASGSFALAGTAAGLKAGRKLAADSAAFTLTGQDVTLTYAPGVTYSMTADSGAFTLSGQSVALLAHRVMAADSGSYVLTGDDVNFSIGTLQTQPTGSGPGWNIDFTGIESRIAEERADREERRRSIERIYRRATGQPLPEDKPAEFAAAEAMRSVKPAARKRMQAEVSAIAEIDQSLARLEKQIEAADMAYLLAEEQDIVWIVSNVI